jgi:hypothetical protein
MMQAEGLTIETLKIYLRNFIDWAFMLSGTGMIDVVGV